MKSNLAIVSVILAFAVSLDRLHNNRLTSWSCESRFLQSRLAKWGLDSKATSLFAISAFLVLWVVPAIDLPETNFDEANTPTNDMVVQESACLGCTSSLKAFVPRLFAHTRKTRVSNTHRSHNLAICKR